MKPINPITRADYPDPDIIRVGNVYYMISTTMYFMPGGEILRSYDLIHWEIAAHIFDSLDDTPAERLEGTENCYGKGMWAATLRYHKGRFYVIFVSHGQEDTHLFLSDSIEGSWEHRKLRGYYHDCSLLFDEDRVFLVYGNMQIHLTELNDALTGPKIGGVDEIIIKDDPEQVFLGYEGSHFYKINGKYYITLIHWPKSTARRTEAVFVSDSVTGPYIGRDVCWDDMGYHGQGVAQGGIVDTPEGDWYSIMFRDSGAIGRVPVLVPVHFDGQWPVFGDDGKIPEQFQTVDGNPGYVYESSFTSDFFCGETGKQPTLKPQWQWNHVPNPALWAKASEGGLQITTGKLCTNLIQAQNVLTQRMSYPRCAGTVTIDASGIREGDYAGLCAHQGCYAMIGVTRTEDRYELVRIEKLEPVAGFGIGSNDREPGVITERIPLDTPVVRVRIEGFFEDMEDRVTLSYEKDGSFLPLGGDHKLTFRLDHFTGARFGLAIFSTKTVGGTAVFRDFVYEHKE